MLDHDEEKVLSNMSLVETFGAALVDHMNDQDDDSAALRQGGALSWRTSLLN